VVVHAGDSGYSTQGYAEGGFSSKMTGVKERSRPTIKAFNIERAANDWLITMSLDRMYTRFPNLRIASVENGNPLFWDEQAADELTDGPIAPPTMLSVWFRPHHWSPGRTEPAVPLQAHFDLKDDLDLPEAIISSNTITFRDPVRIGDRVRSRQVLRSISQPKTTKLGRGRFWVIDVEYLNQDDDLLGVESYTAFGYRREEAP
jgi:acyl dehydratase